MSHDDNNRPDSRDRGAYTPPTDDDLPFNRGGFDPRRTPSPKAPPVTLIISGVVLLALIVAVVVIYNMSGPKASQDAPSVGTPVGNLKVEAPLDAQPVDAEEGIDVYRGTSEAPTTAPTFTAPPEEVQPRPAPRPTPVETAPPVTSSTPPVAASAPAAPKVIAAPAPATTAPASTATGASAVQIGAFSTTAIADREFAAIAARYPQFARGSAKRVQEVTAANGTTVYRTTFTGLSRERAQAFCSAIKAGGGDCLVR